MIVLITLHPSICCYWRCFDNSSVWSLDWFHSSLVTWRMQRSRERQYSILFQYYGWKQRFKGHRWKKIWSFFRLKSFFCHISCDFIFTLTTQMSIYLKKLEKFAPLPRFKGVWFGFRCCLNWVFTFTQYSASISQNWV